MPRPEEHLRIVPYVVARTLRRFRGWRDLDPDDLRQEGYLALVLACERYREIPERTFASYAFSYVRGAVNEEACRQLGLERKTRTRRTPVPLPPPGTWRLEGFEGSDRAVAEEALLTLPADVIGNLAVAELLATLRPHQRHLVEEVVLLGRPLDEVGAELRLPGLLVGKRLRYALSLLAVRSGGKKVGRRPRPPLSEEQRARISRRTAEKPRLRGRFDG